MEQGDILQAKGILKMNISTELIKIKIRVDKETRTEFEKIILEKTGAQKIHSIGQTLTLFLANPKDPQFDLTL